MAKENKTKKKEPNLRFGDQFKFNEAYTCKGHPGIFTLASSVHKSGTVKIMRLLQFDENYTVKATNLTSLDAYHNFQVYLGSDPVTIKDVFSNLHEYLDKKKVKKLPKQIEKTMEIMVPNYDEDHFKHYHANKILTWYDELTTKMKELEREKNEMDEKSKKADKKKD